MARPSSDLIASFVSKLQRLLTDGEFVSTYKLALLLALTRWAVENPDHDEKVPLDAGALALPFLELYWPHVIPFSAADHVRQRSPIYGAGDDTWQGVLCQDRGGQIPSVLRRIREARAQADAFRKLSDAHQRRLLRAVRQALVTMPLWKLHTLRDADPGRPFRFLYRRGSSNSELFFEAGAVACLAYLAPLIEETVRATWLRFILRYNQGVMGSASQVEEFLFPGSRATLEAWRDVLHTIQGDDCFYCQRRIPSTPVVDHFLPWTRWRRDLGHNFVLAHHDCNARKSDHLASAVLLKRWHDRNHALGSELAQGFDQRRLPHDLAVTERAALSLYRLAEASGAAVWDKQQGLVALDPTWRTILGSG